MKTLKQLQEEAINKWNKMPLPPKTSYSQEISFIKQAIAKAYEAAVQEIIGNLETNPNPDGSVSPNLQHWIEMKQIELRGKYLKKP